MAVFCFVVKIIVNTDDGGSKRMRVVSQYPPVYRRQAIILHGSTSQKTNLNFILAAVRT
jgi:hypothetical protein